MRNECVMKWFSVLNGWCETCIDAGFQMILRLRKVVSATDVPREIGTPTGGVSRPHAIIYSPRGMNFFKKPVFAFKYDYYSTQRAIIDLH